ncbi:hypothetical protein BDC45DRAFT_504601 [Circinella umbellata]|nr:hypothetical protein BDC45DRAFT_504601 [Circinella umbellata]
MSYLNADCLAAPDSNWNIADNNPPSPPYSTSSSSDKLHNILIKQVIFLWIHNSHNKNSNNHKNNKAGRKKRMDSQPPPPPASIAPAPLRPLAARVNNSNGNIKPSSNTSSQSSSSTPIIVAPTPSSPPQQQQLKDQPVAIKVEPGTNHITSTSSTSLSSNNNKQTRTTQKRKREHLNALEEEKQQLSVENEQLKTKVAALEAKVDILEKENNDLKRRINGAPVTSSMNVLQNNTNNKKTTGVVFMIILFSFALFSLPARTVNQLTVGGHQPGGPLSLDSTYIQQQQQVLERQTLMRQNNRMWKQESTTTAKNHRPRSHGSCTTSNITNLNSSFIDSQNYLYSPEFSQVAPIPQHNDSTTLDNSQEVLGSRVIDGQLLSLDQCPFATSLLHNFNKDDLLTPITTKTGSTSSGAKDNNIISTNDIRSITNDRRVKKDLRRKLVGEKT